MTRSRTLKGSVVALVAAFALSACTTHPGAAAVVGSDTISDSQLDDVALALCSAQSASQTSAPQDLAGRAARVGALSVLLNGVLSKKFGESLGVYPDQAQVSAAVTANQTTIDALPASRRAAFTDTLRAYAEGQLVVIAAGKAELTRQGTANPSTDQAIAAGTRLRDAWAAKNVKVSVDPRYGRFSKGALVASSGSLSVPVSATAKSGAQAQPASTWVSALPAAQQCS